MWVEFTADFDWFSEMRLTAHRAGDRRLVPAEVGAAAIAAGRAIEIPPLEPSDGENAGAELPAGAGPEGPGSISAAHVDD